MGTTISMLLPESQAEMGAQIVRTLFSEWEQTLSRFFQESELSQLNMQAGKPVAVSDLLYDVLATALTAAQALASRETLTTQVPQPPQLAQASQDSFSAGLTPRENEVLCLLATGLTSAQIAEAGLD